MFCIRSDPTLGCLLCCCWFFFLEPSEGTREEEEGGGSIEEGHSQSVLSMIGM